MGLIEPILIRNKATGKVSLVYDEEVMKKIKPVIDGIKRTNESMDKYDNAQKEIEKLLA
jgi:hypothetical protein